MSKMQNSLLLAWAVIFCFVATGFAEESIAYSHLSPDGYWQIWTMEPSGQDKRQVTTSPQDKREPAWSKDAGKIAFRNNNGQLFVIGRNGQGETEILSGFKNMSNPFFSSAQDEILFVRFDPRLPDVSTIWQSDAAGRNAKILMQATRRQYQPSLSPKGDKIAFVKADARREHHIWMMHADGTNPRQLTEGAFFDVFPSFSPDEKTIAFASNREDGNYEIFSIDIDSKKLNRLTKDPAFDSRPCFSPDGGKIAFISNRSGTQEIWLMNKDGANFAQLTQGEDGGESIDPAWVKF